MIGHYLVLAAALATSAAVTAQTATTRVDRLDAVAGMGEVDRTTQTQDVRFKNDQGNRMTVPVRLSGAGPYRFLVDTGADRTAVSRELVAELKLPSSGGAALHSVSGVSQVAVARVSNVELTRQPEKGVDAAVLDRANIGADGILGTDILRSQRVQFDFEHQTMSIVPSGTPEIRNEPGAIVVAARRKSGRLIVTDSVVNGQSVTVVLDTGAELTIGNDALRQKLEGKGLIDPAQKIQLLSVTGEKIEGDYMFVNELTIGGVKLANLAVVFTDAHTFKQLGLERKPALLLGMNAIRAFKKVSIDFANKKFRVVVPEQSALDTRLAFVGGLH
jgi:predicted aspartyl protease